jgi:hypothetical protein
MISFCAVARHLRQLTADYCPKGLPQHIPRRVQRVSQLFYGTPRSQAKALAGSILSLLETAFVYIHSIAVLKTCNGSWMLIRTELFNNVHKTTL